MVKMEDKKLKGKRFVALVRCSTVGQADTSISAQHALIDDFARAHGMVCAGTVELPGVSGSIPGIRTDIDELIKRKRERDDFEIVLLQDATRFTRCGPAHGLKMMYDLRAAGLDVVFVKDDVPLGDMGDVIFGLQLLAGKEQVRTLSHASTRGAALSLAEGRRPHCGAPSYGIDRLFTTEDGTPKHIIRNLPDGTQVKLDPHDRTTVLERFGRNAKTGAREHYIKQKSEKIVLVPGDPARVAVVREMFTRYFRDGWGYVRIARDLNDRGTPAGRGGVWGQTAVRQILHQPIYLGSGFANIFASGIFYVRGSRGPEESPLEIRGAECPPRRRARRREDWVECPQPALADLLDAGIKLAAAEKQATYFDRLATRRDQPVNRDRHKQSAYILKGLLLSEPGGYPMTGRQGGRNKLRYYAVGRAFSNPASADRVLRMRVPAEPLEWAVLTALWLMLRDTDYLKSRLGEIAKLEWRARTPDRQQRAALEKTRGKIVRKIALVIDALDDETVKAVQGKLDELQAQLRAIDAELREKSDPAPELGDPEQVAARICERLGEIGNELPAWSPAALRNLLRIFVARLVVNLETRHVEVEFAVPSWANLEALRMGLDVNPACKVVNEAHPLAVVRTRMFCVRDEYVLFDFAPAA
jgi:hypothetical protein